MKDKYCRFLNDLMKYPYFRQEAVNYAVASGGDIAWLEHRLRLLVNKVVHDFITIDSDALVVPPNYKSVSLDPLILELADLMPAEHPLRYEVNSYAARRKS